jgi:hypothetical protein
VTDGSDRADRQRFGYRRVSFGGDRYADHRRLPTNGTTVALSLAPARNVPMLGHEPFRVVTPLARFDTTPSRPSSQALANTTLGGERFAEQNSAGASHEPIERLPDRVLAQGQIDQGTGGLIRADDARLR